MNFAPVVLMEGISPSNMTTIDFNALLPQDDFMKADVEFPRLRECLHNYDRKYCKRHTSSMKVASQKSSKKVVFSDKNQIIESKNLLSQEEINSCWLKKEELHKLKMAAKKDSERLRRKDAATNDDKASKFTMAYKKTKFMLNSNFKELMKLPLSRPDEDLTKWCLRNDGRRGLEKCVSKNFSIWRSKEIRNARKVVFNEQDLQREMNIKDPDAIAKVSRDCTNLSRSFAGFLGAADATAMKISSEVDRRKKMDTIYREEEKRTSISSTAIVHNSFQKQTFES